MQCLAKTWPIQLNEKGAFPLGHKILQSRKFFKLENRERDAESKSAMRSYYSTGCTCLLLNKGSMDKEILILFQNKYYCLPVLDIPVSERNGNRERKLHFLFFIPVKNPWSWSQPVLSALFLCSSRNSTIKIGRRLSHTLELYTEKWNSNEESRWRLPYLCFSL